MNIDNNLDELCKHVNNNIFNKIEVYPLYLNIVIENNSNLNLDELFDSMNQELKLSDIVNTKLCFLTIQTINAIFKNIKKEKKPKYTLTKNIQFDVFKSFNKNLKLYRGITDQELRNKLMILSYDVIDKRMKKIKTYYVDPDELYEEIILSKKNDMLTERAGHLLHSIAESYSRVYSYKYPYDRLDCISGALVDMCKYWRNFDPNKSIHAFPYFTSIAENGIKKEFKKIYPEGFKDKNLIPLNGETAISNI